MDTSAIFWSLNAYLVVEVLFFEPANSEKFRHWPITIVVIERNSANERTVR